MRLTNRSWKISNLTSIENEEIRLTKEFTSLDLLKYFEEIYPQILIYETIKAYEAGGEYQDVSLTIDDSLGDLAVKALNEYIYSSVDLEVFESLKQSLREKFFPQGLFYTDNEEHNSFMLKLTNYFIDPLTEYVYFLSQVVGIDVLNTAGIQKLEGFFLHLFDLPFNESFLQITDKIKNAVYNPTLQVSDYWEERKVYFFQSTLPSLSEQTYSSINLEEFMTSGAVSEDFNYNILLGWENYLTPQRVPTNQESSGVYDEL